MLNLLTPMKSLGSSTYFTVDCYLSIIELERTSTVLDSALQLDFGLFVLFNLYCPNETSDARLPYKMNYNLLLVECVRRLIQVGKREVIVTGDMNVCAAPTFIHCDGEL